MAGLMVICSSNGRGGPGIMMASTVWSRSMEAHGLVVLFLGEAGLGFYLGN